MPKPENIEPHKFPKGKSGNPAGRPPKLLTTLVQQLKKEGHERATASTVAETIEYLIALPEEKLIELGKDKDQPVSVRIVIRQLLGTKGFEALSAVLDRAHGRPKQQMDVESSGVQQITVDVKINADDLRSDPIE